METFAALSVIWAIFAGIAAIPTAPIAYLGRHRVHWRSWELLVFVLPFVVWDCLLFSELSTGRKSISNLLEPLIFTVTIPVAALVRVIIGTRLPEHACAVALIVVMCLVAGAVFFLVPPLPE